MCVSPARPSTAAATRSCSSSECIDLDTIPAVKALKDKGDTGQHILQVCIRYRECETDTVPVLYDECGCDQDKCAPKRILESCQLDVMVLDTLPPKH